MLPLFAFQQRSSLTQYIHDSGLSDSENYDVDEEFEVGDIDEANDHITLLLFILILLPLIIISYC